MKMRDLRICGSFNFIKTEIAAVHRVCTAVPQFRICRTC